MAADPVTATGLLIAGSAASTGLGLISSRQQQKQEMAFLEAETERARLAATDEALVRARGFREALASQLALSSLRSGTGGSLVRQFGAQSISNFLSDQDVMGRRKQFINIASQAKGAQIKADRFARDVSGIGSLLTTGLNMVNLNPSG